MLILTPQQIRQAENDANAKGLSFADMMECAGRGCAEHIIKNHEPCKTAVLCGSGKNGGDGYVIARHLAENGFSVCVYNLGNGNDTLSATMRAKMPDTVRQDPGDDLTDAKIIVDAVFGIGFRGQLPPHIKDCIEQVNTADAVRIAVDIPSGLCMDADADSVFFHADETLTMLCYKPVHALKPFAEKCGKITVIPIGFNTADIDKSLQTLYLTEGRTVASFFKKRPYNTHKGSAGHTLLLMGCRHMPGAAVIAAKGALSAGAGLVSLAFPDAAYNAIAPQLPECLLKPLTSDENGCLSAENKTLLSETCNQYESIAVGCGLAQYDGARICLLTLLENYEGKLLIDADGINILSRHIDILNRTKAQILLTPHPGEMSRLTGKSIAEINADRISTAVGFAKKYNCTLLLKGADTVIATPDTTAFINPTGNPGMARGGSGDLLTGIAAALLAQGFCVESAAIAAAYIHGLCGDIAAQLYTEYAATISRTTECIPQALSRLLHNKD